MRRSPRSATQEFNNGVMVLDLPALAGFFADVMKWMEVAEGNDC